MTEHYSSSTISASHEDSDPDCCSGSPSILNTSSSPTGSESQSASLRNQPRSQSAIFSLIFILFPRCRSSARPRSSPARLS